MVGKRIDPHVHFRDGEDSHKETIKHGLALANAQGVDIVFDMPNTRKPILCEADVDDRLSRVPISQKNRYFLFIGATSNADQLYKAARLVENRKEVIGLKMFAGKSTGDLQITDLDFQRKVYAVLAVCDYRGVIAVHCEKEEHMIDVFDPTNPMTHAYSRPKVAEIESIKDQIRFVMETGFKGILHICHVSCKESLELIDAARREIRISCGVTPHHLMWSESKLKGEHGLLYKMNPPLRSKEDVIALREFLKRGEIDWIETDHAPHTIGEKLHDGFPSGYPSLYLYKKCVEEFLPSLGLTDETIEDLTFNNIVNVFEMRWIK